MESETVDTRLLGETAAKCMESLETLEGADGGKITACGIVVVVTDKTEQGNFIRVYCSEDEMFKQLGLIQAGLLIIQANSVWPREDDDLDGES